MSRLRRDAHREFVAKPIQLPLLRLLTPNIASATIGIEAEVMLAKRRRRSGS